MHQLSVRAEAVTRRTYCRPVSETEIETWEEVVDRVIDHQRWLWERALTAQVLTSMPLHDISEGLKEWVYLSEEENSELEELRQLMLQRKALPSGRTLWLGGTEISKRRESSMFNCAHVILETVYDMVDAFWLLLQGCGVGVTPITGTLTGFRSVIPEIEIIPSTKTLEDGKGRENNEESFIDGEWYISIGDSAEAWAKTLGKILANKYKAKKLVIDFSEIRASGIRLKGYGWISSGYLPYAKALKGIFDIMNKRAGSLLTKLNIIEIHNYIGTVLSSRRSAEICLMPYGDPEWRDFAAFKANCYEEGYKHRQMSNNSLVFYSKPSRYQLTELFDIMIQNGGSEPGFYNGEAALSRAPYFKGTNPCGEILLGNKSFCNLTELDIGKFKGDNAGLHRAMTVISRANYRQTVVDLRDEILQESWHINNEFLRLCGVGITGITSRPDITEYDWKNLRYSAVVGARSMAKELGLQFPKNVTTVKPSGTLSKIMDTSEGIHNPDGRYLFNWINFGNDDPLIPKLQAANYRTMPNPADSAGTLVCLPVKFEGKFEATPAKRKDGTVEIIEVNAETAIEQLERYKKVQSNYVDHNVSITVKYVPEEKDDIVNWILDNWDIMVGVSFLIKPDPTLSAKDLGYNYLPQEYVTEKTYEEYVNTLVEVDYTNTDSILELEDEGCATGACPIK